MHLSVTYLFFLALCFPSSLCLEEEDEVLGDLMGRMWHPDRTGSFGGKSKYDYTNAFEFFDSETSDKEDNQDYEGGSTGSSKSEEPVVLRNEIQFDQDQEDDEDQDDDKQSQKPKGSLVIVFDTTHSMSKELAEVKRGARAIMYALVHQVDSPIHNFIFSPFNDPVVGPLTVTTDPRVMEERMNNVTVYGGGDCPELCLTGLIKALEVCLPNSKVYVFTDAPPKDKHLYKQIATLVQRKRTEVNFVITRGCLRKNLNDLWPYDYIAQASSGHLFMLKVENFRDVLNFVKLSIQPNQVHLASLNRNHTTEDGQGYISVVIDPTITNFTASISGLTKSVTLLNEKGQISHDVVKILDYPHLKVVRVPNPNPGIWKLSVTGNYPFMVRVTATSTVTFNYGFSTSEADNMKNTNNRPLKDAVSNILIQIIDKSGIFTFNTVDILDLRGKCLAVLKLKPVEGEKDLYRATNFTPPNKFFNIRVNGVDKSGNFISRISPTAISPQKPGPPIVTVRRAAHRREGSPGEITCDIESQVPVTVGWKKNGVEVDGTQTCSEACEAVLHFKEFNLRTQGNYTCHANNTAGSDQKVLILRVGNDLTLKTKSPVFAKLNGQATLPCEITSDLPLRVMWKRPWLRMSGNYETNKDHSLTIRGITNNDFGWYWCFARNGISRGVVKVELKKM